MATTSFSVHLCRRVGKEIRGMGRDCRKDCARPHETGCTRAQSRCGRKRVTGMVLGAKATSGLLRQSPVCSCTSPRFAERLSNCWSQPAGRRTERLKDEL